jgi:hypothetical protein
MTIPEKEASAKLRDYVKGLSDIDIRAFTEDSAEAASRQFEHFPSYSLARRFLEVWWADKQPKLTSNIGEDDATLTEDDRGWLRQWDRNRAQGWHNGFSATDLLGRMRKHRHRAFLYLLRTDIEAASISLRKRWQPSENTDRSSEEIAAVERIVGSLRSRREPKDDPVRTQVERDMAFDAQQRRFEADHGRKPGQLPREELDRLRADNPRIQALLRQQEIDRQLRKPPADEWWPDDAT